MGCDALESIFDRDRLFGIDFSGAAEAGNKIWISTGLRQGSQLVIVECASIATKFSCTVLDESLASLRNFILDKDNRESVLGLDFPFGLPKSVLEDDNWEDFLLNFPDNFSDGDPEEFRRVCLALSDNIEHKRLTDRLSRSPFCPYNLRIYKQTFHGISNLLVPLVGEGQAWTPPMQTPIDGLPSLLEICPASTLKEMKLYLPYKRNKKTSVDSRKSNRRTILAEIRKSGVQISKDMADEVVDDDQGDALDSIIAIFAIYRNLENKNPCLFGSDEINPDFRLEGHIFH
jgi:hypothetical protein